MIRVGALGGAGRRLLKILNWKFLSNCLRSLDRRDTSEKRKALIGGHDLPTPPVEKDEEEAAGAHFKLSLK